jgi:adenylate kinase
VSATVLLPHFSNFGPPAKIKLVIVGTNASLIQKIIESVKAQLSSLNPEHVSPTALIRQEISRRTPLGQKAETAARRGTALADETTLALMRRWFWTRKPEAGYILTDFPATLLQAKVFDEWQDARGETLDAVIDATADVAQTAKSTSAAALVIHHYRDQGLLLEPVALAA